MTSTSLLEDAFAHHAWATLRLIDTCEDLSPEQLRHTVPGTRGPIDETLAHVVDGDTWDLAVLEGASLTDIEDAGLDLGELRETTRRNAVRWSAFVSRSPDPDTVVVEVDPKDGFRRVASVGMWVAAALQHGSEHRSQISTALTTLGMRPPALDVFVFGVEVGRVEETPGTA